MSTTIKLRGDTTANWAINSTVVLANREVAVDTTLNQIKVGDGVKTWAELPFATPGMANILPYTKTSTYETYTDEQLLNLPDGVYNYWHGFVILQSHFNSVTGIKEGNYQFKYSSSGMAYRRVDILEPQTYPEFSGFQSDITSYGSNLSEFSDNAAAIAAMLPVGTFYRTGDVLKVVHE